MRLSSRRPCGSSSPLVTAKNPDTAGIGAVNSPAPLGSRKLIEAVEPGLNDGLNGLDANPLLFDKFAQAVAVNEVDCWRICGRRFSRGGGEAAQRDKDSPFGASCRSISLKQG